MVGCFSGMCLCNFGTLFGQCISKFILCDLTVSWYPLQCSLFMFCLKLSYYDLAVFGFCWYHSFVGPADSIATFESEKITALSNLFWCKFSRRSAVRMASIDGFGGLVVSMLASGTQVCGFKPGRSRWFFTGVKILSMPSSGGEVKESVPCPSFAACKRT